MAAPANDRAQGWRVILDAAISRRRPALHDRTGPFAEAAGLDRRLRLVITGLRTRKDLRSFLVTAAYLYACFGLLLLYKAMLLHDRGVDYAPYGLAAGKALVVAKFMLIGKKLQLGAEIRGGNRIFVIMCKSALFFLLIIGLSVIEEVIVGVIHDRSVGDTLVGLGHGRLGEIVATSLLLFVILIPYFAYREIDMMLGEGKLLEMLRHRR
ncbi:MAG TPA: hypothetical protein VHS58_00815 [Acetobacteraceae bacterium]|nr:hypothetical protein [Acetobacteraceae bacterium]